MIVYLARDIPAFVMYCVYGESRSSLLIESTDSMITHLLRVMAGIYALVLVHTYIRARTLEGVFYN